MTTIQAASRAARHLNETDLTRMSAAALADVLGAMNAALQIIYTYLPRNMRETTVSQTLRAPEQVDVTIIERYGHFTSNQAFANMRGCTTRLTDDVQYNEVTSTNSFLDEFLGQSLTGVATVWHDCIPLFQVVEEVTSPIRLYDLAGECVRELVRFQPQHWRSRWHYGQPSLLRIGTPWYYRLEAVGNSQNADPESYLRVFPMPDRDLRVRFEATLAPLAITFAQIARDGVHLPVPEQLCESVLIPLMEAQLLKSPSWDNPGAVNRIQAGEQAAMALIARQPQDIAISNNSIGTPEGF